MSKLWKVEIPFDSSNRFPDMLKTMMLFFDKTVVRLPMIGAGEPFYNKNVWRKVWLDVFQLYRLKYFDCRYVPAFNELNCSGKVIETASDTCASDLETDEFDSVFSNYMEIMGMDHVDDHLALCCPEDEDPVVTWAMKSSTLHFQQRTFQLSDTLSLIYSRKNTASGQMNAAELYNETAKDYSLEMCEAFTSKQLLFPYYRDLSFSEGDYSVINILEKCSAEKEEMKSRLSRLMSGFYPDDKDELQDHILERLDPEVERFNTLLHEGKLAYTKCLRQILGEPSGYTGITVSCFAGLKQHMKHAAKCGDIIKMFEVPYLSDPVNHRKKPLFIRLNNI